MSSLPTEIELKFKLKYPLREDYLKTATHYSIEQIYLDKETDELKKSVIHHFKEEADNVNFKEARIRQKTDNSNKETKYYFTLKTDGTLSRTELEREISMTDYNNLKSLKTIGSLRKDRYAINISHPNFKIIEYDVYHDKHDGLFIVEVEFDSEEHAPDIIEYMEKWIGHEMTNPLLGSFAVSRQNKGVNITNDKQYKNLNLAINK